MFLLDIQCSHLRQKTPNKILRNMCNKMTCLILRNIQLHIICKRLMNLRQFHLKPFLLDSLYILLHQLHLNRILHCKNHTVYFLPLSTYLQDILYKRLMYLPQVQLSKFQLGKVYKFLVLFHFDKTLQNMKYNLQNRWTKQRFR